VNDTPAHALTAPHLLFIIVEGKLVGWLLQLTALDPIAAISRLGFHKVCEHARLHFIVVVLVIRSKSVAVRLRVWQVVNCAAFLGLLCQHFLHNFLDLSLQDIFWDLHSALACAECSWDGSRVQVRRLICGLKALVFAFFLQFHVKSSRCFVLL